MWKTWAAVVGVIAAVVFLAAAELVAVFLGGAGSPLVGVGGAVIDLAPRGAKDLMVTLFGTGDKVALFVLMVVLVVAISAGAGVLERRRPPLGAIVFAIGGVLSLLAVTTRSGSGSLDGAPTVVGVAAAIVVLRVLLARLRRWEAAEDTRVVPTARDVAGPPDATPTPAQGSGSGSTAAHSTGPARRAFLVWGVTTAALAVVVGGASRLGTATMQAAVAARRAIRLPSPATVAPAVPAGASLDVDGITPVITPNDAFYRIDTALRVPQVDPATWKLRIHGAVDREVEVTWDELLALPLEEHVATMSCVSNEVGGDLIGTAKWLGYPIRELLAKAGPHGSADMVLSTSVDGFTAGTPLDVLQDRGTAALLAVGMNGEPLPPEHGFPVRMVVPGLFGYVSATKWVTDLEVTRFADAQGYWTPRGWSERGPVKLESRIDVPRGGSTVRAGSTVAVAGVAWQPHTGVKGVQVRVDDGAWQDATLADSISADTWRQWVWRWTPTKGSHRLQVRATSADGEVQTSVERPPAPNGATGWHEVTVTAS
ncbi:molybdopterin-dependent oxidoreductase [Curtobacterium luteum]|uniref:Oxidoreductase n=1 Tax=Curtobacterium luteum TaxID=33881 RepID=A0A175RIT0_9MICO|nr:molybdopterin-dependent oxidoreductase [Curtobacterium luteum]KTR02834.1 oxidoreductase [Curtobacterium luteum]